MHQFLEMPPTGDTSSITEATTDSATSPIITDSTTEATTEPTVIDDPPCYKCQYAAIRTFNGESREDDYLLTILSAKERVNKTNCAVIHMSCMGEDAEYKVVGYQ